MIKFGVVKHGVSFHNLLVCVGFGALVWTNHASGKSDLLNVLMFLSIFSTFDFHHGAFTAVVGIKC